LFEANSRFLSCLMRCRPAATNILRRLGARVAAQ
jgi:hypothetical protein